MSKFPSYFDVIESRKPVYSEPGSRFKTDYKLEIDEDGRENLVEIGKTDVYNDIQSYSLSCDIHYIIDKFQRTGDVSMLDKYPGVFGDFTNAPKSYAEMLQRMRDAEALFYNLKPEVRAEFDHDPMQFFSAIGTEKFMKFVENYVTSDKPVSVNEGVSDIVEKSE